MSALAVIGCGLAVAGAAAVGVAGWMWLVEGDEHHACDCHPRYGIKVRGVTATAGKGQAMGLGEEWLKGARAARSSGGWGPRSLLRRWLTARDERLFARGYQRGVGMLLSGVDPQLVLEQARSAKGAQQFNLGVIMAVGHWVERVGPRPFPGRPVRPEPVPVAGEAVLA